MELLEVLQAKLEVLQTDPEVSQAVTLANP
jgi:hypothetical protein